MSDKTTLKYEDCTIGANEPVDKYTINRVFRRCYDVAKDRVERLAEVAEMKPYAASEDTPGVVRFVSSYSNSNQRALSPVHVMNLGAMMEYGNKVVYDTEKHVRKSVSDDVSIYTKLNDMTANILPNGLKLMTGSFVVGFNRVDLSKLIGEEKFVDMDADGKDAFYSTMMSADGSTKYDIKSVYVPYIDRARMNEYDGDGHNLFSGRAELSENMFETRMRAFKVTSDVSGERNRYVTEAIYNLSFSIQDFITFCDLHDIESEDSNEGGNHGEIQLDTDRMHTYANKFYFYRKPVIMVQAIDISPDFNKFNRIGEDGELVDLEQPICSGVDSSVYNAPRNTVFVENFSCDYDVGEGSDVVGKVLNNNLTIGLSSRFVIGDDRDNIGFASASKLNHKIKVSFMLIGV